ncbi:hypothetical protein AUP68_02253 [Ilyonectria robusta]
MSIRMQPSSIQKRKGSTIKACLRCHRRKQRCVGFPACTNCRAADLPCSRDSTPSMRRLAGLSKEDLLKKIEALEEQLPAAERHAENSPDSPAHFSSRRRLSVSSTFSETMEPQVECADGNDLQTLQAGEENMEQPDSSQISPTPVSLCSDSGARIPQIRTAVEPQNPPTVHFGGTRDLNERTGSQLLVTYLESMHRRLPFCDYAQILMTLRGGVTPSSASTPMNLLRLYMACAIGAAIRKLTGTSHSAHPEQYFLEASKIRESLKNGDMVEEIEATFWTVLYKLRSSFSSEVWYLIGLAMRTAIEVGLHREHYYEDLDPKQADLHRRLFWAVYIIERNVCWSLKRPFSISDHDIDTNLPLPGINPTYLEDPDHHTSEVQGGSRRPLDLNIFIATIKLSHINAKVYTQLYRVDEARSALDQIPSLLHEIRQFEASLPKYSPPDHDFLQLHINNAIRALIEPSLPTLDPSDYLARRCLEASGGVCQFFKRLRLNRCLGYSFTMLNSVFIAGTTIWYGSWSAASRRETDIISYIIFKDPTLWTPARSNDLRACSSSLFAAAERNSAVRKYCDALETVIEAVMEHVEKLSHPVDLVTSEDPSSPAISPDESQSPQEAFDRLRHIFRESRFEFPSHSYPSYRLKPGESPKSSLASTSSTSGVAENFSQYTHSNLTDGLDILQENHWDLIGGFNGAVDMSSTDFLFSSDQFGQQAVDELLSKMS